MKKTMGRKRTSDLVVLNMVAVLGLVTAMGCGTSGKGSGKDAGSGEGGVDAGRADGLGSGERTASPSDVSPAEVKAESDARSDGAAVEVFVSSPDSRVAPDESPDAPVGEDAKPSDAAAADSRVIVDASTVTQDVGPDGSETGAGSGGSTGTGSGTGGVSGGSTGTGSGTGGASGGSTGTGTGGTSGGSTGTGIATGGTPGNCTSGFHDGGDGNCVMVGYCSNGYHDNGQGTCVPNQGGGGTPVDAGVDASVSDAGTADSGTADVGTADSDTADGGTASLSILGLSAGTTHTCAVINDGVQCWGYNVEGELGDGTTTDRRTPVAVTGLTTRVTATAAGGDHTCALLDGGAVQCWGSNNALQLGNDTPDGSTVPVAVSGLTSSVTAIAAGARHTCALLNGGGVQCWGDNSYYQLGHVNWGPPHYPGQVSGLTTSVTAIAAGIHHTCALLNDGGVQCWGFNDYGQLGDDTLTGRGVAMAVTGLTTGVTAIAAGGSHTCALLNDGGVQCWGSNGYGQLGDGTMISKHVPVAVTGLTTGVTGIAAGESHTCALLSDGGIQCWGNDGNGQLGDGNPTTSALPVVVTGLPTGLTAIAAGTYHTCAATQGGIWCWGGNFEGQLGVGTGAPAGIPVAVTGLPTSVTAIAAGRYLTCALLNGGGGQCWGYNYSGQLGNDTRWGTPAPVAVTGLGSDPTAIAGGGNHNCALLNDGGVQCWGYNLYGQLGDGTTSDRHTPMAVTGLTTSATAIAAGLNHNCALLINGEVQCWGRNGYGRLGDGTTTDSHTPVTVTGLTTSVTAITGGAYHTCALLNDGGVQCWGYNVVGQLGDNTDVDSHTPVAVTGLTTGVTAIAAGGYHTCAVLSDGGVQCWGYNQSGQLGNGDKSVRLSPAAVTGLTTGVTAIAAGTYHTCAVLNDGGVQCWGANGNGEHGDGTRDNLYIPVTVTGLTAPVIAIAAGEVHTCALLSSGGMQCWGDNDYGELGDGTGFSAVPLSVSFP